MTRRTISTKLFLLPLCGLVVLTLLDTTPLHGQVIDGNWTQSRSLTVDSSLVAGTNALNDFPLLVSFPSESGLAASAQSNGADIAFTLQGSTARLDHEIENYVSGTGQLQAWVRVPSLSATSNTGLTMHYGNSGASDQQNATGVWGNDYAAVTHMNETSGNVVDSTAHANDGVPSGEVDQTASGQIAGGMSFDGDDDWVEVDAVHNDVGSSSSGTLSMWARDENFRFSGIYVSDLEDEGNGTGSGGDRRRWFLWLRDNGQLTTESNDGYAGQRTNTGVLPDGEWYHVTASSDGTATKLFVNGQEVALSQDTNPENSWLSQNPDFAK